MTKRSGIRPLSTDGPDMVDHDDYLGLAVRAGCSRLRAVAALAAMLGAWVLGTLAASLLLMAVPGVDLLSDDLTESPVTFAAMMTTLIAAFLPAGMVGGWIATRRSPLRVWSARGPLRIRLFLASAGISAVIALVLSSVSAAAAGGLLSGPTLSAGSLALLLAIVVMTPLQSLGEELVFRGSLVQALTVLLPHGTDARRRAAVVVSSVTGAMLFALMHGPTGLAQFGMYVVGGLTLYLVTAWLAGIEAAAGAHAAMNVVLFAPMALQVEFAPVPAWQTAVQVAGFDVAAAIAIGLLCRRWRPRARPAGTA